MIEMARRVSLLVLGLLVLEAYTWNALADDLPDTDLSPVVSRIRVRSRPAAYTEQPDLSPVRRVVPRPLITARQSNAATDTAAISASGLPAGAYAAASD